MWDTSSSLTGETELQSASTCTLHSRSMLACSVISSIKAQGSFRPHHLSPPSRRFEFKRTCSCVMALKDRTCCIHRCWSALKSGMSADEIAAAHDVMLERMDAEFGTLKRLEALVAAAEAAFPGSAGAKEMDPAATADATAAEAEAAENAQVPPTCGL